ncbi:MAG: type II secretion system protein [Patescibacteria group bacterium]|nr:type II secretion system protein [Patescibacteria group bacterium]
MKLHPKPHTLYPSSKRGFTLVEMIVSLMIFSIVAVVALAAMVKIIDANRKAQTIQDAVTNISYALDSMSRELRTGSNYYCIADATASVGGSAFYSNMSTTNNCAGGLSSADNTGASGFIIAFQSTKSDGTNTCRLVYAYAIVPVSGSNGKKWKFEKAEQDPTKGCSDTLSVSGGSFSPIVDPSSVTINGYYMKAGMPTMSNGGTARFPLAFIELSGSAGTRVGDTTYFTVQTAASPRIPN